MIFSTELFCAIGHDLLVLYVAACNPYPLTIVDHILQSIDGFLVLYCNHNCSQVRNVEEYAEERHQGPQKNRQLPCNPMPEPWERLRLGYLAKSEQQKVHICVLLGYEGF